MSLSAKECPKCAGSEIVAVGDGQYEDCSCAREKEEAVLDRVARAYGLLWASSSDGHTRSGHNIQSARRVLRSLLTPESQRGGIAMLSDDERLGPDDTMVAVDPPPEPTDGSGETDVRSVLGLAPVEPDIERRFGPPTYTEEQVKAYHAARQEGSAEDDGAAMRHTLSVQATNKSDRAEGVAALQQAGEPDKNEIASMAFQFLARKYVQRADDRQKLMGLQYTSAETHDLANEIANFVLSFSPLPQQTALVEPYSPDLDDVNGRLA